MKQSFFYYLIYVVVRPIFALSHPMRIIGKEHIPEGAAMICPNHTGLSDPAYACFAVGMRNKLRPLSKIENLHLPVVGPLLKWAGTIGVDRGSADIKSAKAVLRTLKEGGKILIFPEGTRVKEGTVVEAKAGVALFATRTNSPLIPMYIPAKKGWFRRVTVVIGEPYYPEYEGRKATAEELEGIAHELMRRIQALGEGVSCK